MGKDRSISATLGSDEVNLQALVQLFIIIGAVIALSWFAINVPEFFERSRVFWMLSITGLIMVAFGYIITKKFGHDFNVPISGTPMFNIPRKVPVILALVSFPVTFFILSASGYNILSPSFAIVDITTADQAVLIAASAIAEDVFFFAFLPGFIFSVVALIMNKVFGVNGGVSFIVAAIVTVLATPYLFMTYHTLVYGLADVVRSVATFVFALEMSVWMIVMRDLFYPHMRHIANNLSLFVFATTNVTGLLLGVLLSPVTWIVVAVVGIGAFFYFKNNR